MKLLRPKLTAFCLILIIISTGCAQTAAPTDSECDAWLNDESITSHTDKKVFQDLCYFSKAIENENAAYCLSASSKMESDCVENIAAKFNQPEACIEYIPDTLNFTQATCVIHVAGVQESSDACQNIATSEYFERCNEVVEICQDAPADNEILCSLGHPLSISCDHIYDETDRSRCESEFYETFISL